MLTPGLEIEMTFLEKRLAHFEHLLEMSKENKDGQPRTNAILQEINKLSEKLNELRSVSQLK